jgi:RHS repeat-associated protein
VRSYQVFGTTSYQATNGAITAAAKRYRYTGMERDDETGLNYHNARYYIPWLGRWLNADPIGIGDGVNVYAYCKNNPVAHVDKTGTQTAENKQPDENPANKLGDLFTPAKPDPNIDTKNVRAAGTDGGAGATNLQNMQKGKPNTNLFPSKNEELRADNRSEAQKADDKKYGEEINWSTPRAVTANLLEKANPIGKIIDIKTAVEGGVDRKGRPLSATDAVVEGVGTALLFTPIKFGSLSRGATATLGNTAKSGISAANGLKITGFAEHGLNRAIGDFSRVGVKPNAILDAVKTPLKINNVVTDQLGRQSQRFIGKLGEIVVNPQTGKIISVNPTSTSKAAKLFKQLGQ